MPFFLIYLPKEKIGREINPHIFMCFEFENRVKNKDHFVISILKKELKSIVGNIDDMTEISITDRDGIIRASHDLAERVVRGHMPRLEKVLDYFCKSLTDEFASFKLQGVDLWKYGEMFNHAPKAFYGVFEVEELVSQFLLIISENDLIKMTDHLNISVNELIDKESLEPLNHFMTKMIQAFSASWASEYMALKTNLKGITNDVRQMAELFSYHDVVIKSNFEAELNDDIVLLSIAIPCSVAKAVDSATT